jgi:hypothetical protein
MRTQISTSVSARTRAQADELMARYGYSLRDVVSIAIDRMHQEVIMSPKTAKLFWTPSLPEHWVAQSVDEGWVMFPATEGGWAERTPYRGHLAALQPCDPATERMAVQLSGGAWNPLTALEQPWINEVDLPISAS